jgi:hypothetical protein
VFVINILLGFSIGLALGLLGGGGSILTVPALVYLVGQSPQAAVTTSLAIVGANSIFGASFHKRRGTLDWKVALLFGGMGMLAAYLAAGLSHFFSPALLMVMFAMLMLVVGVIMLRGSAWLSSRNAVKPNLWLALVSGTLVGLLTGVLGVGGGFLIVPALVMLVGLPMTHAVGTSLAIIAANSFAGLMGHLQEASFDFELLLVFVTAGIGGTYLGMRLGQRLPAQRLRQAFAVFVMLLAVFLLVDNLPRLF